MVFAPAAVVLLLALSVASAFSATTGKVEGKVMYQEKPVAGATVYACDDPARLFGAEPAPMSATTDSEGRFVMELPKGDYYLGATMKMEDGSAFFSFYGGNPVSVAPARAATATLNLLPRPAHTDSEPSDGKGGIDGVATYDGKPLDGVKIFVYLDANDNFRGMGYYMSPPTGVDGRFRLRMSEGKYYVLARKRMDGATAGPLKEGDYFGYLDINPVVAKKGRLTMVEVPMVKKVEKASPGGRGRTVVRGIINDALGHPVQGVYACLYKNPAMVDRPTHVSKPTGVDGAFEVEVPLGGRFYLAGRDKIGEPVGPGQLWGRYAGSQDHSISVETGETLDGLELKITPVE